MKNKVIYTKQGEEVIVEDFPEESFCLVCGEPIPKKRRGRLLCLQCYLKNRNGGLVFYNY